VPVAMPIAYRDSYSLLPCCLMAKLGFLGLGIMGYPMARNLIRAGHDVALWSHSAGKATKLASEAGGKACESPRQVAEQSDCMFLCVGDTTMSEQVTVGPNGIIDSAKPGSVVADASTISPEASRHIREKLAAKGIQFLDAPCTGSKPGAEKATLTFMIGGEREVFEKTKPYFEAMGKQFYYCGGSGKGLQAKLTQNLILANIMQAFNEGMVLSTKGGIDPKLMLEILDNSAAKSGLISFKAPYVMRRDFTTNFSTKWMHKDISLALETAEALGVPLPLTGLTQQMFRAAIAMGYGDDDMCSTVRVMEQWAHTEVRDR
jgi:3-hydroxyisobutyrate dehydrogenase-like beta-hydroxyacid dehydrogenase